MSDIKIDFDRLEKRCTDPIRAFDRLGEVTHVHDLSYVFIDNHAPVLAVAHLDTVQSGTHFFTGETDEGVLVFNPKLDDRLGAYIILDLLPKFVGKRRYDILLTTGEESGRSTAGQFATKKQYNWMFEFDRGGTDVVMYRYENTASRTLLQSYGFVVGTGSYTDICDLDSLGCLGFNIGCGYKDYHSKMAYANTTHTLDMVRKFARFFADNANTHMAYTKPVYRTAKNTGTNLARYEGDAWGDWLGTVADRSLPYRTWMVCQQCGFDFAPLDMDGKICRFCASLQDDDTQPIVVDGGGNG